ncbi:MAG: DUF5003 domain-containing protein [Alistipes sp.]|nr:DUF5003 domain-containing protein [Alistipes sp.]
MNSILKRAYYALIITALVGAASCEGEDDTTAVELPKAVEITCKAGDTPTFTFTAAADWQLSSDATWCKFDTAAGLVLDTSGKAGENTIRLNITDENIKSEATRATLSIKMGDKSGVIATVVRDAKKQYMHLYDSDNNPASAIEIGYVDWISFSIEADFRFAAVEYPAWVEFEGGAVTGVAGKRTEARARIVPDGEREQYPITEEDGVSVTFTDESGDISFSFPVIFKGMDDTELSFTAPTSSTYGWEVSLDGKSYRQKNEATGEYTTFEDGLTYKITALNNDYEVLLIERVVDRGIPSYVFGVEWMTFDKTTATLSVEASDSSRYGVAMVLPRGTYNAIVNDIKSHIIGIDDASGLDLEAINSEYQRYIITEFTQMDFTERDPYEGMYVYHSLTIYEIPCMPYTNAEVIAKYGATEAFTCPFPLPKDGKMPSIIIDPRIEGWTTDTFNDGSATVEFYYRDQRLKASEGEFEMCENKDEVMATRLMGPTEGFEEEVYVIFKVDGVAKKLLVVTPPVE